MVYVYLRTHARTHTHARTVVRSSSDCSLLAVGSSECSLLAVGSSDWSLLAVGSSDCSLLAVAVTASSEISCTSSHCWQWNAPLPAVRSNCSDCPLLTWPQWKMYCHVHFQCYPSPFPGNGWPRLQMTSALLHQFWLWKHLNIHSFRQSSFSFIRL